MKFSRVVAAGMLLAIAGWYRRIGAGRWSGERSVTYSSIPIDGGLFNTCAAGELSRLNTIYIPYVVARAVANSFAIGPSG